MTLQSLRTILTLGAGLLCPLTALAQPVLDWENTLSVTSELIEGGTDMVVDDDGNAIVLGYLAVEQDFFVLKFDPAGELLWDRIIGGSSLDSASGVAVDGAGDVYLAGRSLSEDFPTVNAYQPTKSGPSDAILMKLDGEDGSTVFSTYFGGTRAEWATGVALGPDGAITITGQTDSINLETVNAIQDNLTLIECFCDDAFVTQFSPGGDQVLFSSYLGGTFDDTAGDVAVDTAGNIYFAGRTRSDNFPTENAVQPTRGGGEYDAFVVGIAPDYTLTYSTFLGGEDLELVHGLDVDDTGAVYVTGSTRSISFPTTPGAFQEQFVGGINACEVPFGSDYNCEDMYVTKLTADGSYAYSTYIGGHSIDEPRNIALDAAGRAHVIGYSYSDDFPLDGPQGEYVVVRLNASGSDLDFLISHDCPNVNSGGGIAVRGSSVFIAAKSGTINGNQVTYDTYVAKFGGITASCGMNGDDVIDAADLAMLLGSWGPCDDCAADMNGDGVVNATDLAMLLGSWGPC